MLSTALKYGIGKKSIIFYISECLAIFYINKVENIHLGLLEYVSPLNTPELMPYYFKTLEYCVADVISHKFIIDGNNRKVAEGRLSQFQAEVVDMLSRRAEVLNSLEGIQQKTLITCFTEWINICYN